MNSLKGLYMSFDESNGNGRGSDREDFVLDVTALKVRVGKLEKEHDTHEEIFNKIAETQSRLSERVVALEVQKENDMKILQKLQKETSLQTKLLSGILVALMGAAVTIITKAIFHF